VSDFGGEINTLRKNCRGAAWLWLRGLCRDVHLLGLAHGHGVFLDDRFYLAITGQ
jgi:hypothetical protein